MLCLPLLLPSPVLPCATAPCVLYQFRTLVVSLVEPQAEWFQLVRLSEQMETQQTFLDNQHVEIQSKFTNLALVASDQHNANR